MHPFVTFFSSFRLTHRATNPSEFSVEFFVNDLSLPGATTFQNLGVLEYNQNGPIHYKCDNKVREVDPLIIHKKTNPSIFHFIL